MSPRGRLRIFSEREAQRRPLLLRVEEQRSCFMDLDVPDSPLGLQSKRTDPTKWVERWTLHRGTPGL
eukprot:superscaffoldBa00001431_g10506